MRSMMPGRFAGACFLVVPMLANVVMHLFDPLTGSTTAEVVRQAAAHPAAAHLQYAKLLLVLQAPAAVYLMYLACRSPRLAAWGGGLTILGIGAGVPNMLISPLAVAAADNGAKPEYVAFLDMYGDSALVNDTLTVMALAGLVGAALLGAALWRADAVPRWAALAIALLGLLNPIVHILDIAWAITAVFVLWLAAYSSAALRLMRPAQETASDLERSAVADVNATA